MATQAPQAPLAAAQPPGFRGTRRRAVVTSLLINGAAPFVIYYALKHYTHVSDFFAIVATGVPSTIDSLVGVARNRRIDVLAGVVLVGIAVSLVLISLGGSTKLYLIRESFFTAAFGLAYLVSLLFPKPLAYYFARQFMVGNNAEGIAWFERFWQSNEAFRNLLRRIGLIWAVALLFEAALRTYLVLTLTTEQFLAVSPFVFYGITGALILWSFWIGRRARRRGEAARRRQEARQPSSPTSGSEG